MHFRGDAKEPRRARGSCALARPCVGPRVVADFERGFRLIEFQIRLAVTRDPLSPSDNFSHVASFAEVEGKTHGGGRRAPGGASRGSRAGQRATAAAASLGVPN